MARKQKYDEGTRNRLLQVATDLIFEKGFDGTAAVKSACFTTISSRKKICFQP